MEIIILLLLGAGPLWFIGFLIVGPFEQALGKRPLPPRFVAADFFGLIIMLQSPLSVVTYLRRSYLESGTSPEGVQRIVLLVGGLGVVLAMVLWWRGVRVLTALEIRNTLKRILFLGILLPGVLVLPFTAMMGVIIFQTDHTFISLSVSLGSLFSFIPLQHLANWIIKDAKTEGKK